MTRLLLPALLALALAACSAPPPPETGAAPASSAPASAEPAPPAAADQSTTAMPALRGHHWQLQSATSADGEPLDALLVRADRPLQLDFSADGVNVTNSCNAMHGRYALGAGTLQISALAGTMMACADARLMALDAAAGRVLAEVARFELDPAGPQLVLTTSAGETLRFHGVPTAETRYGGEGTTEFLEVAPETVPCNHPLRPDARCLQVRALSYDADGLRTGEPGPWEVLGAPIEGYTHQPGVRNVLRVKRWKIENPPADASSIARVLDLVVETEVVPD